MSFAQKRGLTPYRKGKLAFQPQRVRGLSPFLGKAPAMTRSAPRANTTQRRDVPRQAIRDLSVIPGIGPSLAADLYRLGIQKVESLKGRDPEALYRKLFRLVGQPVDRCVLYAFRCAVYFASETNHDPQKLKWWNWKDEHGERVPYEDRSNA